MSAFLVSISAESFLARLRGAPDRLKAAMVAVITRLSIQVQTAVKDKLSGAVLHVQTGTLRRSINRLINGDAENVIATIGTNVKYAAVHEYGFDGDVTVRAHVRRLASQSIGKGKHQTLQGIAFVREFVRHMVMPEKSFLRSTLVDFGPQIRNDVKAAALAAVR